MIQMRSLSIYLLLLCSFSTLRAQEGHDIKVKIDGFQEDVLYLGYHLGNKQYIQDTVYRGSDDTFRFVHETEELAPGLYMVIMPPNNSYFELIIEKNQQFFSVSTDLTDLTGNARFNKESNENTIFYAYLNFLNRQRERMGKLNTSSDSSDGSDGQTKEEIKNTIDQEVKDYQLQIIRDYPESITAAIIKASLPLDYSPLEDKSQESMLKYTQEHFFDNVDLSDIRLLRTPLLQQKIEYFIDKLHIQTPEYIIPAIDEVLATMDPNGETFKYFVIHFLNKYAKSKIVGMDEVYVHLAQNYYAKGLAPWTEASQLKKIIDNANALEPLLIGKTAPNLALQTKDGYTVNLHDLNGEYTVVYFWESDCENCKKTDSDLETFFQAYKDKGVKISAICTNTNYEAQDCWDYIEKKNYNEWIHLGNPNNDNDIWKAYNVTSTPLIYLLDRDKKIVSKRISAKQLSEVMDNILGN